MSPTCSSNPLAGSTARSANVRITWLVCYHSWPHRRKLSWHSHTVGYPLGVTPDVELAVDRRSGVPGGTARGACARCGSRRRPLPRRPPAERPRARRLRRSQRQYRPSGLRAARVGGTGQQRARPGHLHRRRARRRGHPARAAPPDREAGRLLSTEGLEAVRDDLVTRLHELDAERAAVRERLDQLGVEEASPRRATPSLSGARIRWVGA